MLCRSINTYLLDHLAHNYLQSIRILPTCRVLFLFIYSFYLASGVSSLSFYSNDFIPFSVSPFYVEGMLWVSVLGGVIVGFELL